MKNTEKTWQYISTRVLESPINYAKAIAEEAAAQNMSVAAWAQFTMCDAVAVAKGLPRPEKPSPALPPRVLLERAAKARGLTVDEYMAAIVAEAVKKDTEATGRSGEYAIALPKNITPAKHNRALRNGTGE
jgi:hypothetical protein